MASSFHLAIDRDGDLRMGGTIRPCSTRAEFSDVKRREESLSNESDFFQDTVSDEKACGMSSDAANHIERVAQDRVQS